VPPRIGPTLLALASVSIALLAGSAAVADAQTVIAGTWTSSGDARLLQHVDGVGWSELPPPASGLCRQIWDLEVVDDDLWVACTGPGKVLRWDGMTWFNETPSAGGSFVAIVVADGAVHAVEQRQLLRRTGPRTWTPLGTLSRAGQATVSTARESREMIFMGQDLHDEFWVHDPLGSLSCPTGCPSPSGQVCGAGCYGGSCIFAMAEHDGGRGVEVYAGAYNGAMYSWPSSAIQFVPFRGSPTSQHVQALESHDGELWLGDSGGGLFASPTPGPTPFSARRHFGNQQPISELASLEDKLWVATGGVPFGFARRSGNASVWTFDGSDWVDMGEPGLFDNGVLAFALFGAAPTPRCDAGPEQDLECEGTTTPVTLDGSNSFLAGLSPDEMEWSGPFIEGSAFGLSPLVHFDGPGDHLVTLTLPGGSTPLSCTTTIRIADTQPPELLGLPGELVVSCSDPLPPAPEVSALDACDPAPTLDLVERTLPGPCEDSFAVERTWTARDASGHRTVARRHVNVQDLLAPDLSGVPDDAAVACDAVPVVAAVGTEDDCDPEPALDFDEVREDGPCADSYRLLRNWTTVDRCGNESSAVQVVDVTDSQGPTLIGVPPDETVECDAVPPPALVSVEDACDESPQLAFVEVREDGACPDDYTLRRTWTATDRCGNVSSATQVVRVVDTQPPVIVPSDEVVACLWPPNHRLVCIDRGLLSPMISDACSDEISWVLDGCVSSQPNDDLGDGSTESDCLVAPDGESACLRSERQGLDPAGRSYALSIRATDACGNVSEPVVVGTVHVPHDSTGRKDCPVVLRPDR